LLSSFTPQLVSLANSAGCTGALGGEEESELIRDAKSITANPDGTFRVVCKDGRIEPAVTAEDIATNKICKPLASGPKTATSWSSAVHSYIGSVYAVSNDSRYAVVNFDGIGFGRFDLKTYTLTHSYGARPEATEIDRGAEGDWFVTKKAIAVAGTLAMGLQIEIHNLADPAMDRTFIRRPKIGEGNLSSNVLRTCKNGTVQWSEGAGFGTALLTNPPSLQENQPSTCYWEYPAELRPWGDKEGERRDVTFNGVAIAACSTPTTCVPIRTMPSGTEWVVFARTGEFMAYKVNGIVYRSRLGGQDATELNVGEVLANPRDGVLIGRDRIYDVQRNAFTSTAIPSSVTYPMEKTLYLLANGVSGVRVGSDILLVNINGESVLAPLDKPYGSEHQKQKRPGIQNYYANWIL
jgi:hypothetical protein